MANDVKLVGGQRELFPKHQFIVEIDTGWWAGFQTCSELSYEVAKIEHYEGGSAIPLKVPGRVTMTDVTLERGASTSKKFYEWATQIVNAGVVVESSTRGTGTTYQTGFTKEVEIVQLDRDGKTVKRRWTLHKAWPTKFVAGDWDNNADEVVIESLTLTFDYFEPEA